MGVLPGAAAGPRGYRGPVGTSSVLLFLSGDVMTGRGIDQILPHPGRPGLAEQHVDDARTYVRLAESRSGPVPAPVDVAWPWGDVVDLLDERSPDARILNVETSITTGDDFAPGKSVHYRMHPDNIGCLRAAAPDVCVLANNHVLDFGVAGLSETLDSFATAGLVTVGAGRDVQEATAGAGVDIGTGRVLVHAVGSESSGVPPSWAATPDRPGVAFLPDPPGAAGEEVVGRVAREKRPGDLVVVSVHWGSNWGYAVGSGQVAFAHRLIDAGADVVHGHSSHHPRPVEVYRGRLVLYGCGDLVNDYEGIGGHEQFRGDLRLLPLATLDASTGELQCLELVPLPSRRLRLQHADRADADWLCHELNRAGRRFGCPLVVGPDGQLLLQP